MCMYTALGICASHYEYHLCYLPGYLSIFMKNYTHTHGLLSRAQTYVYMYIHMYILFLRVHEEIWFPIHVPNL